MMTEEDFNAAAADLAKANGLSFDQASLYVALIGDVIELEDGLAIVRDEQGAEIARVRLSEDY